MPRPYFAAAFVVVLVIVDPSAGGGGGGKHNKMPDLACYKKCQKKCVDFWWDKMIGPEGQMRAYFQQCDGRELDSCHCSHDVKCGLDRNCCQRPPLKEEEKLLPIIKAK